MTVEKWYARGVRDALHTPPQRHSVSNPLYQALYKRGFAFGLELRAMVVDMLKQFKDTHKPVLDKIQQDVERWKSQAEALQQREMETERQIDQLRQIFIESTTEAARIAQGSVGKLKM